MREKKHLLKLLLSLCLCFVETSLQAAQTVTLELVGHEKASNGFYYLDTNSVVIKPNVYGIRYVHIDGVKVFDTSTLVESAEIDISPYMDGISHRMDVTSFISSGGGGIITFQKGTLIGDIYYTARGDSAIVAGAKGGIVTADILNSFSNRPVTSVGYGAFRDCKLLTSVQFPSTMRSLEKFSFENCCSLTSVNLPESLIFLGEGVFRCYENSKLTTVMYNPTELKYLEYINSDDCIFPTTVKDFIIGDNVKVIPQGILGEHSYYSNYECQVETLTIPESVTTIGPDAFNRCTKLKKLYFNAIKCDDLEINGKNNHISSSFPSSISSVIFGEKVTYIPERLLAQYTDGEGCQIESLNIPESVERIGDWAFSSATKLKTVRFPSKLTEIGGAAFSGCESLESLEFPNSLTTIGGGAFSGCNTLKSVTIPENITTVGEGAFSYCNSMKNLIFNAKNCTECPYAFHNTLASITFGEQVKIIPDYFLAKEATEITTLTIPEGIEYVGREAFSPPGLKTLYFNAINCQESTEAFPETIENLVFGDKVTRIPDFFLYNGNNLTSLTIPESVTYIGENCFDNLTWEEYWNDASTLRELNFNAINCTTCGSKNSSTFPLSLTTINIGDKVTKIPDYFVNDCKITTLDIPNSVTTIGTQAFARCSMLDSISAGTSVSYIGDKAFMNCVNLTKYNSMSTTPPRCANEVFAGIDLSTCKLYIPEGSYSEYKNAYPWIKFNIVYNGNEEPSVVHVSGIRISDAELTLKVGDEMPLSFEVLPNNATDKSVVWSSSNPDCVIAKDQGNCAFIEALSAGTATVTVTTVDGNYSASCTVTVLKSNSIENIGADEFHSIGVYTLGGIKLSVDIKDLAPGMYIIRQGTNVKKITVK